MAAQKEGLYIFEGLTQKEIAYFIMMSETLQFRKGDKIITEWEVSDDRAYLIESGSVDIYRSNKLIASLHSGDIFGEMTLITDDKRSATIVANSEVEVLVLSKDEFLMLCKKSGIYEDIKRKILQRVKENFYSDK